MTSEEIASVVGKDQQPWWPQLMWGDGEWWSRQEAKHVTAALAKDAFIGAMVQELVKRSQAFELCGRGRDPGLDIIFRTGKCVGSPSELATLHAAIEGGGG